MKTIFQMRARPRWHAAAVCLALLVSQRGVAIAQSPDSVVLSVMLDHADWRYHVGDSARFSVSVLRGGRPVPGARASVEIGMERMAPLRRDTMDALQPRQIAATLGFPGFLRATVRTIVDGRTYTALATAAFDPERITATMTAPSDFEAFWRRAIEDARRVPLAPIMTRLPDRSTPEVDVFHVSFQNQRVGSRIYGMLSVPTKAGKYPAMLVVPGAGVRPYFPSVSTAKLGVIHLTIGIHGIPVDRDSLLYNELRATALQSYWTYGIESRDSYYYKRVYVGAVRAGDFIFSLPQFDGSHYVVQGESQGGGLSIMLGAIDPRVKAIAASYPAMSDQFGYFAGHPGGWPHLFQDTTGIRALSEKKETIRYYDVINFARLLRVPGIYAFGFNDNTVPPTSSYATYNTITAPKEVIIVPETGHFRVPSQRNPMDAWLLKQLGLP
ncbi:MAG: acetylxylan esterase [Gemmatimonadota bacterium]